jgi:uncharacterized membrane protein
MGRYLIAAVVSAGLLVGPATPDLSAATSYHSHRRHIRHKRHLNTIKRVGIGAAGGAGIGALAGGPIGAGIGAIAGAGAGALYDAHQKHHGHN